MDVRRVEELVKFSKDEKFKAPVFSGDHSRVSLFCLEIGQGIKPHIHDGDHVWVIEEGTGFYLDGEGETKVSKGDVVFAPEGEPHGIRAETRMVFLSISAGS